MRGREVERRVLYQHYFHTTTSVGAFRKGIFTWDGVIVLKRLSVSRGSLESV